MHLLGQPLSNMKVWLEPTTAADSSPATYHREIELAKSTAKKLLLLTHSSLQY